MRKIKIYIDTSVISNLKADDAPDMMESCLDLWGEIKQSLYEVVISNLVIEEVGNCPEPKRSALVQFINDIEYQEVTISAEAMELAARYIKEGIIPQKHEEDALHIAIASILDCNAVVSLNFSHMVKLKTIMGVNGINATLGYRTIEIVTPLSVINKEHDEE